jgi:hypothetical protein
MDAKVAMVGIYGACCHLKNEMLLSHGLLCHGLAVKLLQSLASTNSSIAYCDFKTCKNMLISSATTNPHCLKVHFKFQIILASGGQYI